ncbi:hypothetical protein DMUE_2112 [Dictyocoela muelleri]|nr:hypothetical protein DMUE_2112 [Dictyocoela muelleri]
MLTINDQQLIFLDETGFKIHTYQRLGYSPKNTKCFINVPNSKGTNVSVLCAITNQGVPAYKVKVGSFKSVDMKEIIQTLLPAQLNSDRKYIVMDNASIHRTAEVKEALLFRNYILMFLSLYSPQLNPNEEFFSCIKSNVKRINVSKNSADLISSIDLVFKRHGFLWMDILEMRVYGWRES